MKRIAVVGSFMTDLIVTSERFVNEGETIIGESFGQYPGGKGANQAVAAARLGGQVTMFGKLGRDAFGEEQVRSMASNGIDHSNILFSDTEHSGVGNPQIDSAGQNRIVVIPGANMAFTPHDVDALADKILDNDIVLLQLEIPMDTVERTIEIAHDAGKTVILNPAPAQPLRRAWAGQVDWITPNEHEAELLTGIKVRDLNEAECAADALLALGFANVLITLGDAGSYWKSSDGDTKTVYAYSVDAVDTVGAGDAYIGSLAYGLASGRPVAEALEFAAAVAAISVTRHGCQPSLPSVEEVSFFLKGRRAIA